MAKITRPRLPPVYARTRLLAWLDEATRRAPIVWIEGPPGAGKTTLAGHWLTERRRPALWYQVDAGDRDLASFFHYLGITVAEAAPRYRTALPKLTPEYLAGLSTFTRNFFRELGRRLKPPFVLVLDNLQEAGPDAPLYEVLREGLEELPPGACALLLSRAQPPPAFARWQIEQRMRILDWTALRLLQDESIELVTFLAGSGQKSSSTERAQRLHRQCDGWLAGMLLLHHGAPAESAPDRSVNSEAAQVLFDYFAAEVFNRRHPAVKEFLMQTALFPAFTVAMAEKLTGNPRARALLDEFVRLHYFTERRADAQPLYQYHPLFREFLLKRAADASGPIDLIRQRHRAAAILERAGELEQALALYLDADDSEAATRLILGQAQTWVAAGRLQALGAALARLPSFVVEQEPWLLYWRGVSCFFTAPAEGARCFARAYEQFEERNDLAGLLLAWSGIVDVMWQQQQDWSQLDPWIGRLEARLQRGEEFPSDEVAARVVSSLFWILVWRCPTYPQMARWAEEAARLWERTDEFSIRLRLGVGLCTYYILVGEAARFRTLGETQLQLAGRKGISPDAALLAHMMGIYGSTYGGLYPEASDRARAAFEVASVSGIHVFDCLLYGAALYPALGNEDFATADELLNRMGAILAALPTNLDTSHHELHRGWRARLAGDSRRAVRHAESAVEIACRIGAYYPEIMCRYGLAHAYLADGDLASAQRENDLARAKAQAAGFNWWLFLCGLFEAYLAFARADETLGAERLRDALALQARFDIGYLLPLWSKAMVARLCVKAFEHDIATTYVRKLLRMHRLHAADPPLHLENWPWPIKIRTLGRFAVLLDDRPLAFGSKTQKKPLELLKALAALGGRDVSDSQLIECLWPDADGDRGHHALEMALSRLRKLLGSPQAVLAQGKNLSLNGHYIWLDVWSLEQVLEKLDAVLRGQADNDAFITRLAEQALSLYRGPFLVEESDAPWALTLRERLRSRVLRALRAVWRSWEQAERWQQAAEGYERALEIDNLAEEFYQRLMLCYRALGRPAEALAVYRRCRQTLHAILGIAPAPETEAIAQALRQAS